jgi:GDSL-like Lipase/Acylhydrolase
VLILYFLSDCGWRLWWHHHLETDAGAYLRYGCTSTEAPLYRLDPQTGYSYVPDTKVHLTTYDEENNRVRSNTVVVNNFGHLSPDDDAIAKGASEFRIAVLGDSFSATTPSDLAWPTVLQRRLNDDPRLRRLPTHLHFKVINFGLDGTGFVQWPSVDQYKVQPFHPDLVIVNFIANDVFRRFLYRSTVTLGGDDQAVITCSSLPASFTDSTCVNAYLFVMQRDDPHYSDTLARLRREMLSMQVQALPWLSTYPELLAVLLHGRLGLHSHLQLTKTPTPYFSTSAEAIDKSKSALEDIARAHPALLVLYHPMVQECLYHEMPSVVTELSSRVSVPVVNMLTFLPLSSGPDEIRKWYNLPYDQHPSDYGAEIYGSAVEGRVFEYLSHTRSGL